jgi:hypothetical protein
VNLSLPPNCTHTTLSSMIAKKLHSLTSASARETILPSSGRKLSVIGAFALSIVLMATASSQAQITRGFDRTAPAYAGASDLARQPDLWMMEVQFKNMRMVFVDLPDPQTGELKREQVWYLAWRAIVRPLENTSPDETAPENVIDTLPGPRQFIPKFTLITYDDPNTEIPDQILQDEILPAAMTQLRRVERTPCLNSVQVIQDVPEPISPDEEEQPWIYGAATWRGVNPDTDFFKVILSGFTNAYEVRKLDDETPQVWRKVIVQKFARPGDRFDPSQREFQFVGDASWIMQPDALKQPAAKE